MTTILRRLLQLIPTLIGVSLLTFLLMRSAPGDPVKLILGPEATPEAIEAKRAELGFDKHILVQYLIYMKGVVQLDLGTSIVEKRPVSEILIEKIPATLELGLASLFFATLTGLVIGIISSVYPRTFVDNFSRIIVFIFLAMPGFWLGLEAIILFSRNLEILPPANRGEGPLWNRLDHLILPALCLGVGSGAFLSRILRSSMLQVLNMDYVRTARAKGLDERRVIMKHALKNALIPFVTLVGLSAGSLLGGAVIIETVFNWPGLGKELIDSIKERDFPVTMGATLILALSFVLVNLLVDLLYVAIDPRIRLEGGSA